METLVATVLIVIVFMTASSVLNAMFRNGIQDNSQAIGNHLTQLQYQYYHGSIPLPYQEQLDQWQVAITKEALGSSYQVVFKATHIISQKSISQSLIYAR